jgi:hypothetical protein
MLAFVVFLERAIRHRSKARKYRRQRDWLYKALYVGLYEPVPAERRSSVMQQVFDELEAEGLSTGREEN